MRIATWNINSVRLRLPIVLDFLKTYGPDILCLQETKCPDELFPLLPFSELGYEHIHIHGMKSYNGLAIISKIPFDTPNTYVRVQKSDCRHASVRFKAFELHNLYIPAGGYEADMGEEKFRHKLDFVDEIGAFFKNTYTPDRPMIALGDMNIAPMEHDVWSHKQMLTTVSHTPVEVEKFTAFQNSLGWTDAIRHFVPEDEKCYTWWSYRNKDWKKSNRGRRLDHIWVTEPLAPTLKSHEVLVAARDWEKPSDHVPVMLDLDV